MKTNRFKRIKWVASLMVILAMVFSSISVLKVVADSRYSFSVSPMKEKIMLNPGEKYTSSLSVYTSTNYDTKVKYQVEVDDFFVDENYNNIFSGCGDFCEMKNWITIDSPKEGILAPGEKAIIKYTIDVPEDAAGGGQYASIRIQGDAWTGESEEEEEDTDDESVTPMVKEVKKIAYTIYAEVAGDVDKKGEILDINVPSFILSGDIKGISSVKNTGNVHGEISYKMQVFPLFSSEEIYTNEEDPVTRTILPDRTLYNETAWEKTPGMGIFNVVYTVEFEGVTGRVERMVIKCPIWMLFIIIFIIMAIIIYFVTRFRARRRDA